MIRGSARLARKKRLPLDLLMLAVAALPVTIVARDDYVAAVPEATSRIGRRDPDDVDVLALALHLRVPVWSNDNDFEDARTQCVHHLRVAAPAWHRRVGDHLASMRAHQSSAQGLTTAPALAR